MRERLPEYFIPSLFIVLDKLPLTANGKVDRRALPAPEYSSHSDAETFTSPRTPEEKKIAEIWTDVLDNGRVDIDANFFDLGGHSLLATKVITRIREAFGLNVPLRVLFDSPTIAGVAAYVAKARPQSELNSIAEMVEKLTHLSEDETKSLLQQAVGQQEL